MSTEAPNVWTDEDGDAYYGDGHIPPEEFKRLCHALDVECLGEQHDCEWDCSAPMRPAEVEHSWWAPVDPNDEETSFKRSRPDDPAAQPFTIWRR